MLDKLKRLFIVEEESTAEEKLEKAANAESNRPSSETKAQEVILDPSVVGQVDQKYVDILLGALEKNNQEGYDYLEYKQALQSLKGMGMDEATMFKSALAMAATMGANKDKILQTGGSYLQVLEREQQKFNEALNIQNQKLAQTKDNGIANLESGIVAKQKQVENLLAEIEKDKARLQEVKDEISQSSQKIQQTAANFVSAYSLVSDQIKQDLDKIKKYIN
jgi:cytochrome c556